MNYNKVVLGGVVCSDLELRTTRNGTPVTNFVLKTFETWKNPDTNEWNRKNKWHKLVCWGKNAEKAVSNLKKNSEVLVEGSLGYHTYTKGGEKRDVAEIKVIKLNFVRNGDTKHDLDESDSEPMDSYDDAEVEQKG